MSLLARQQGYLTLGTSGLSSPNFSISGNAMIQGTTAAWEGCYRKNRSFVSLSCNTATAMLKHCFSTPRQLSLPSGKSLTVHGCKHRHGFTPSTNRLLPFFHNALKCQVNQLLGGFFMRKHGSSFDYLPNATVESLNTVGRIQLLPNRPGKVEEGYLLCPGRAPTLRYMQV